MPDRDDFPQRVKSAVALRANYLCSFEGCAQPTAGPSDESPLAVAHAGFAAHIHAASSGGKRYLASMTSAERSDIGNAVWMCPTHATLIDQDDATYSADKLRAMKAAHEARVKQLVASRQSPVPALNEPGASSIELFSVGPKVICLGELIAVDDPRWALRIDHFVMGDLTALTAYISGFDELARYDRYVVLNELGDGRSLKSRPSWRKVDRKVVVEAEVEQRFPRSRAQDLGEDLAVDDDLIIGPNGDFATVAGLDALPQRIRLCLWHQRGELLWDTDFGTRIAEYYHLFHSSPWLGQLIKLEAVRLAAIPYQDIPPHGEYTPFNCVERVLAVSLKGERQDKWIPAHIELDVCGVGPWELDLRLYVPEYPFPSRQAVLDELLTEGDP